MPTSSDSPATILFLNSVIDWYLFMLVKFFFVQLLHQCFTLYAGEIFFISVSIFLLHLLFILIWYRSPGILQPQSAFSKVFCVTYSVKGWFAFFLILPFLLYQSKFKGFITSLWTFLYFVLYTLYFFLCSSFLLRKYHPLVFILTTFLCDHSILNFLLKSVCVSYDVLTLFSCLAFFFCIRLCLKE